MINSGVNRYDNATGDEVSDVYAVSTESRGVTSIVQVGPGLVHSYGTFPGLYCVCGLVWWSCRCCILIT